VTSDTGVRLRDASTHPDHYRESGTSQHGDQQGRRTMATARLRRALARVRPSSRVPRSRLLPGSAAGGYDRTHDGLVSGWLCCPTCGTPPTPTPDLLVDGQAIESTRGTTPRGDVPGGLGFLLRFAPTGTPSARIRVHCPTHPQEGLSLDVPAGTWATPALAAIEHSTWPIVTGWIALLAAPDGAARLEIDGNEPIPVRTTVRRPDVQAYLGTTGVGGFHVDLGAVLGYALPDTTIIRLVLGDEVLAEAFITDSPLGDDTPGCLPISAGSERLDDATVHALRRRFRDTGIDTSGDWRDTLDRLGQREYSAESEQWADYLAHHGQTPQQVSAWLALLATHGLGVPALNPLPADLDAAINPADDFLPERVRTWTEPILGIHDRPATAEGLSVPPPAQAPDLSDMKVTVAGLVHHKSGLGQNAQNSLKALDLAGIHACPAPFFPARGGWNPRLGPTKDAIHSLEDHTVLLHLPIDQVIPSLAAQPTLLRTDRLIGYFMWELETVPKQFHRALQLVDEIWTATEFVAEAFRKVTDTPVHVIGHAVDISSVEAVTRTELGIPDDSFVVHYSFDANSTVARKNPNAALDAFRLAFEDDPSAVFVLKVRNYQQLESLARQGDPSATGLLARLRDRSGVKLLTGELSYPRSLGLIQMADCYISLHRSEGFGFALSEAMALGTPVLATAYSGNLDVMRDDETWLVAFETVAVAPGEYFSFDPRMRWADPDATEAAALLIRIRAAEAVREKAGRAQVTSRLQSGTDVVSGTIARRLNEGWKR
jgi:glycosyltransferase involved in cell wall biosynthesis